MQRHWCSHSMEIKQLNSALAVWRWWIWLGRSVFCCLVIPWGSILFFLLAPYDLNALFPVITGEPRLPAWQLCSPKRLRVPDTFLLRAALHSTVEGFFLDNESRECCILGGKKVTKKLMATSHVAIYAGKLIHFHALWPFQKWRFKKTPCLCMCTCDNRDLGFYSLWQIMWEYLHSYFNMIPNRHRHVLITLIIF